MHAIEEQDLRASAPYMTQALQEIPTTRVVIIIILTSASGDKVGLRVSLSKK